LSATGQESAPDPGRGGFARRADFGLVEEVQGKVAVFGVLKRGGKV
jgi:hypothetical protein